MAAVCAVCGRAASVVLSYTKRAYCRAHFRNVVIKRLRKDLRHQGFDSGAAYRMLEPDTPLAVIAQDLVCAAFGRDIVFSDADGIDVLPWCLEQDVDDRFRRFLAKEPLTGGPIRVLRSLTLEELSFFGDIGGLAVSLHPLVDRLEKKQSGTLFAFARSLEEIGKREKENR